MELSQVHTDKNDNQITEDAENLSTIHLEKQDVIKGDDSDGRIEWSSQQVLASLSLCALYSGECSPLAGFL